MPLVLNSNFAASSASLNLSRARDGSSKSLKRLSSGNRINSPAEDGGGLAVEYKLKSEGGRTLATMQNTRNALSFLQVQDGAISSAGKIFDRMSQLRTMANDITKNSGDIENYSKESVELQLQLDQVTNQSFNGISLFASNGGAPINNGNKVTCSYQKTDGTIVTYEKFGRMLQLSPSGNDTKVSINIINLEFVASYDALDPAKVLVDASGYASRITDFSVSLFTDVMEKISDVRAESGAEPNPITNSLEFMEVRYANMQTVHGRIMDADIASESTRFARNNVLIQTSAAMDAQANQLTNVVSTLIQ